MMRMRDAKTMTAPKSAIERDPRWAQVLARDPGPDGQFVYAVRTTGVYGRPGDAARLPRPENVEFFESAAAAEAAGYRPSRRVASGKDAVARQHARLVAQACRSIEAGDPPPGLAALAREAGLSAHHFHRIFHARTGLTPKAYAAAVRTRRARTELGRAPSVTDAIYEAGFGSNGRFYAHSDAMLGMTPTAFRAGGAQQEIRFAVGQCSLGAILVARSSRGICAITLGDDPDQLLRELQDRFPQASLIGADAGFETLVARVVGMVEAPGLGLDLPLDVRGTAFQQRVWAALRAIPAGTTISYAELARRVGMPRAARAVAQACAANALAVAIPCHRVVRGDGSVSGYRWGVERKRALLLREHAQAPDQTLAPGLRGRRN